MVNFKKLRQMMEVKGNGKIATREIIVSTFVRLHLGCNGIIELHQSDEEKVIFEADENLLDHCAATNAGRTLYVSTREKIKEPAYTSCVVKVFLRQLNVLYVRNDQGNVICPKDISLTEPLEIKIQSVGNTELNINVPTIKLSSQCQGNVIMKGKCNSIDIKNQSEGDFTSKELIAEELTVKNMAQGNVELFANKTITISHYGQGYIHFYGGAVIKDVKQYGDGLIQHKET
jgi:hypothetical protein